MKKEFVKELTELINKHGLEKEMKDTPDYILAQVCVDAMAVFTGAIALRDEWYGFKKADEQKPDAGEQKRPKDCNNCKDRFKCMEYLTKQPIIELIRRFKYTKDREEQRAICQVLKDTNEVLGGKIQNEVPEEVKDISEKLSKSLGANVEIHRIEIPKRKRIFRKKPRKEVQNARH